MDEQPSLGELIRAVRRQLEYAQEADAGHLLRFDVDTVELDVDVEVSKTWTGDGGFDVKVLRAGASRESVHGSTSRMHVVLTPFDLRTSTGRLRVSGPDTEPVPPAARESARTEAGNAPGMHDEAGGDLGAAVDTEPPSLP